MVLVLYGGGQWGREREAERVLILAPFNLHSKHTWNPRRDAGGAEIPKRAHTPNTLSISKQKWVKYKLPPQPSV